MYDYVRADCNSHFQATLEEIVNQKLIGSNPEMNLINLAQNISGQDFRIILSPDLDDVYLFIIPTFLEICLPLMRRETCMSPGPLDLKSENKAQTQTPKMSSACRLPLIFSARGLRLVYFSSVHLTE